MQIRLCPTRGEAGFLDLATNLLSYAGTAYSAYNAYNAAGPAQGPVMASSPMTPTVMAGGALMPVMSGTMPTDPMLGQMMPVGLAGGGMMAMLERYVATAIGTLSSSRFAVVAEKLIKLVGPIAAATILGVKVEKLIAHWFRHKGKRRRHRGISARDLRCTRRTARRLCSAAHSLGELSKATHTLRRYHRPRKACA